MSTLYHACCLRLRYTWCRCKRVLQHMCVLSLWCGCLGVCKHGNAMYMVAWLYKSLPFNYTCKSQWHYYCKAFERFYNKNMLIQYNECRCKKQNSIPHAIYDCSVCVLTCNARITDNASAPYSSLTHLRKHAFDKWSNFTCDQFHVNTMWQLCVRRWCLKHVDMLMSRFAAIFLWTSMCNALCLKLVLMWLRWKAVHW